MILAVLSLLAALSSADAISTVLNSRNACSEARFATAIEKITEDARAGKTVQQFVVGLVESDPTLSKRYLDASREKIRRLAEKTGNPLAWYILSMEKNDFTLLQKAVDGENVQALNAMGSILIAQAFNGTVSSNDLERTLKRAYDCFNKAAAHNDPNGFINLGTCYLRGFGCTRDTSQAFLCFRSAAEAGHPEGMDNMSACYQFGYGVKADSGLSLYWAMRARALRGDKAAAQWLKDWK